MNQTTKEDCRIQTPEEQQEKLLSISYSLQHLRHRRGREGEEGDSKKRENFGPGA